MRKELTVAMFAGALVAAPLSASMPQAAPAPPPRAAPPPPPAAPAPPPGSRPVFAPPLAVPVEVRDTDKNGELSRGELEAAQTKLHQQQVAADTKRSQDRFKQLDANKDGQLSIAEFTAPLARRRMVPDGAAAMTRLDTNKDGKVTAAEYRTQPLANFDRLDANDDGAITPAERAGARRR